MADHFAGPRRRTEDVQALGRGGRPGRSAGPFLGDPRQGFGSDGKILSDRRHSGSRARRVLDPPVSGEGRDREPRGGRGLDRGFAASSPRQDRQDRWRGAAARVAGVQARRAAGVLDGAGSHASGRGSPPDLSRAQDADRRADTACQSDQRPAVFSGIGDYEPLRRDRRRALEEARTGDGRALGANMKAQIGRELDRLELLLGQIAAIEAERDAMLARQVEAEAVQGAQGALARVQKPMDLNGPGAETVPEAEAEAAAGVQSAQSAQSAPAHVQKLMDLNGLGAETVARL